MPTSDSAQHRRFAVRAAWLFDGTSPTLLAEPMVIVNAAKIVAVESHGEPPGDAEFVDLGGATLLPRLVDTHVHLAFGATADPVSSLAARDDDQVVAAMIDAAHTAASGGVTTVRDLGDRDYLSLHLNDRPGLPTVVTAGPPITTPGGHCHYLGGVVDPGPDGTLAAVRVLEIADRSDDTGPFGPAGVRSCMSLLDSSSWTTWRLS